MKKGLFTLIFIITIVVLVFVNVTNKSRKYELSYNFDSYNVIEKYDGYYYTFNLSIDDIKFDYAFSFKYVNKRKLIKTITSDNVSDYLCLQVTLYNDKSSTICYKDGLYYDKYQSGLVSKSIEYESKRVNNVTIFNDDFDVYLWNGYGITNAYTNEEYKVLKNNSYDNKLYYQCDKYLIFADYDQTGSFNTFYIFNVLNKKYEKMKMNFNISFDSYFMGDKDGYVYLFDRKEKKQYKINISKMSIKLISNKDGGTYYDGSWKTASLEKMKYNDYYIKKNKLVDYIFNNKCIYLKYYNSNQNIIVSSNKIRDIIYINSNNVFYLIDNTLYSYNDISGETKLMEYFEWEFSYKGKIFAF